MASKERGANGRFLPGKTTGRPKGALGKQNRAFREAVMQVFHRMGEHPSDAAKSITGEEAFLAWARTEPTEFYKIAARLIPTEVNMAVQEVRPLVVDKVNDEDIAASYDERQVH